MKIAVPKETTDGETRVALIPADAARLVKAGLEVVVEQGAGLASGASDEAYSQQGAKIESDTEKLIKEADIVLHVRTPGMNDASGKHELDMMSEGKTVVAHLSALGGMSDQELLDRLTSRKIASFALDCVPRITRAQSMDVLSSMSNISGYKAVLLAAQSLPKIMPLMTTAAGTLSPSRVFIIGAGVAGLQAIATAKRLGAVVEAFDTRPVVKEQVQSLGAKFVEVDLGQGEAEGASGYAKQLTEDQIEKQRQMMARHVEQADAVITTALIPGRPAPEIVTEEMVKGMKPGSVIVDLAAENGGNCTLTKPGETTVVHGVTIIGQLNLPADVPVHASQAFSRNIQTFLMELLNDDKDDRKLSFDMDNEIIASTLITRDGKIVHEQTQQRTAKESVS